MDKSALEALLTQRGVLGKSDTPSIFGKLLGKTAAAPLVLEQVGQCEAGPLYGISIPGDRAVALWQALRGLVDETQHWPLVMGEAEEAAGTLEESAEFQGSSGHDDIAEGEHLDVNSWLQARQEELAEYEDDSDDLGDEDLDDEGHRADPPEEDDGAPRPAEFTVPYDVLTRKPFPSVLVALVPTTVSWQVPALIRWGAWNDCPRPAEHVAFLKRWQERYGAELVCLSRDVLEVRVGRPPLTESDARPLAEEQFLYCADIVYQGCGSVASLARVLARSQSWYFWWD